MQTSSKSSSSWLVAGAVAVLVAVVTVWALRDIQRNRESTGRLLAQQGAGLIKALEAGARTGMRGRLGRGVRLEALLQEAGRQDNILFIAVTDRTGRILAHSNPARIEQPLFPPPVMSGFMPGPHAKSRLVPKPPDGPPNPDHPGQLEDAPGDVFLVYRDFLDPREARNRHGMNQFLCPGACPPDRAAQQFGHSLVIFVGLDPAPFYEAVHADARATIFFALLILAAGGAAIAALSWAARARASGRKLSEARAFADELVANLPAGLIACDASGTVVSMNESAGAILQLDPEEHIGRKPEDFLTGELYDVFAAAHAGKRVVEQEIAVPAGTPAAPQERTLLVSASTVSTANGEAAGSVLILRDVSELKQLEEQVRRQEKLAAVGQLAAGVAHEIRNPLSSIKGFAVHLGSRFPKDSADAQAARTLVAETDRLNRVVTELIEYARPTEAARQPTDPAMVIEHTLRLVRQQAADAGVTARFEPCGELFDVDIDPDRVNQALLNLCLNAIQAMDHGGELIVRACVENGALRIDVEDTGPGIDPDLFEQIFDPYYTTKASGQGLGLAVVRKVAQAHGGYVEIDSAPGAGSRFTLVLPFTRSDS